MSNIETEIKYLLGRESFHALYQHLKQKGIKPRLTRQINYYFSSSLDPSGNYLSSTRIRYARGKWELTCKISIFEDITDTVQNCYEYNAVISRDKAMDYIKNGLSSEEQLKQFGSMYENHGMTPADMYCFGCLRTARFAFNVTEDMPPLLLDLSRYLGVWDYELEWELKQVEKASELLRSMFNTLGITPSGSMMPKVKRFFDRLANMHTV